MKHLRVVLLALLAFVLIGSYELIRSGADAVYVKTYGRDALPYAWLGVALASLVVVSIYSRFVHATHLLRLLAIAAGIFGVTLVALLGARTLDLPGTTFALYVFKDVYIVVLIEIFWSYANVVFDLKTAKWIYGLFCAMGSLGGAVGAEISKRIAEGVGTETTLWSLAPVLFVVAVVVGFVKSDQYAAPKKTEKRPSFLSGLETVRGSRYLLTMLLLIGTVQLVITLIDFLYTGAATAAYPDQDELTAVFSRVNSIINISAVALQLFTGPVLKLLGVALTLILIPSLLGSALGVYLIAPQFIALAVAKVLSKCLDYSLFRAAKEMLYIPLDYSEKTSGKAVVDMLTYRVAKGAASVTLLLLVALALQPYVGLGTALLVLLWIAAAVSIGRQYRRRTNA
ncbi:MAG: Npt1/Npt2 family nucleotide transporter [Deltaproteobacteria bacterium]